MKNKNERKQNSLLQTNRVKTIFTTLLFVFLFSKQTGQDQYNFIAEYIKIKVSETAAPSIALDEVNASIESDSIAPLQDASLLRVGPSLLPQLELEEFVITELEQKAVFSNANSINRLSSRTDYSNQEERSFASIDEGGLSKNQSYRLQSAEQKYKVLEQDWNPPIEPEESLGDKIKRLNQQIVIEENVEKQKSGIIIRGDPELQTRGTSESSNLASFKMSNENKAKNIKVSENSNVDMTGFQKSNLKISGHIEFVRNSDPLLVLTPDHRIEVRRFAEGVPHEFAEVKPQSGTFSIDLQNSYGTLVAQLINAQGVIEGQDSIAIQEIINNKKQPHLVIKPIAKGKVSVASAYGVSYQKEFAKTLNFDVFSSLESATPVGREMPVDNRFADAESVVQVSASGHIPTTAVISLQSGADLMLMPEKMIKSLTDILSDQGIKLNLDRGDSLIWGVIRDKGQPIEGATVIAERTEPIYVGSMYMPDKLRTKTSESGIFVIVVNEPGWKDLFVQVENGPKMHLNVLTFPGKVSQVIAELPSRDKQVSIRTFDALNGEPVRARVQLQQVEDITDTGDKGISVLQIPDTKAISFLNIFPEAPYLETRQSYTQLLDFIHIPLIRKEWFDKLKSDLRINNSLEKGTIIGFVQNEDFILVPTNPEQNSENLIYFNTNGEVVSSGSAGGGFILFNQTSGFSGITIRDRKKQSNYQKVAFPDEKFISILNFTL